MTCWISSNEPASIGSPSASRPPASACATMSIRALAKKRFSEPLRRFGPPESTWSPIIFSDCLRTIWKACRRRWISPWNWTASLPISIPRWHIRAPSCTYWPSKKDGRSHKIGQAIPSTRSTRCPCRRSISRALKCCDFVITPFTFTSIVPPT